MTKILVRKASWMAAVTVALAFGCGNGASSDKAGAGSGDRGADPTSSKVCVYRVDSWATCVNGTTTTSSHWECEALDCADLPLIEDSVVGGKCAVGGAKNGRHELPGVCDTYLPPGASTPTFPETPDTDAPPKMPEPMVSLKLDQELLEACRKAVARDEACSEEFVDPDCEHYAQVEAHEMIDAYLCHAKTPCGVRSDCAPEPTTLGQRICAELEGVCSGDLNEDWCADMDVAAAWIRPDVLRAVDVCFARKYCTDMQDCVDKWVGLVWQLD